MINLYRPNIKPRWRYPIGVTQSFVFHNCRKYGFPVPVLAMPIWERAGNKIYDTSGQMNRGTLINNPIWAAKGLIFNGTSQYVSVENESKFDFERNIPFSIFMRINPNHPRGIAVGDTLIAKNSLGTIGWIFEVIWNDVVPNKLVLRQWLINTWGSNFIGVYGSTDLTNDKWWNIAVTYTGSSQASGVQLYVNGKAETMTTQFNSLSATILNNLNVTIGARNGDGIYFHGLIDNAIVFKNSALTAAQIQFISNNPYFMFEPPEELRGYVFVSGGYPSSYYDRQFIGNTPMGGF